nr:MAG TPA: hypothetical protein [Caudoviricetes sp.]
MSFYFKYFYVSGKYKVIYNLIQITKNIRKAFS